MSINNKLISVIIPTFNRANLVGEAIQSVKNQTYPNVQIIVIDDGSTDNTAQIVKEFADVEYYFQENKGQAAARNAGLKYAKGEYLASLDSDDIWNKEFLEDAAKCLENHNLDFVFSNWISLNGKESFLDYWERAKVWRKFVTENDGDWSLVDAQNLRRMFLTACPTPSSSLLIRRSSIVPWNEEIKVADDWLLILEMVIAKPCRAAFTLSPHWLKRVFGDNIYDCRDALQVAENIIYDDSLMNRCLYSQLSFSEKITFRKRLACNHLQYIYLNLKQGIFNRQILNSGGKAITLAPFGSISFFLEVCFGHLKNRFKLMPAEKVRSLKEL